MSVRIITKNALLQLKFYKIELNMTLVLKNC